MTPHPIASPAPAGLSSRLWETNQDLARATLNHPFVQGIGQGTLPKNKFAYYVGQDAFFLEAFAKAYSIVAAKAPTWESFKTFHELAGGVLQELQLHESYAKTWGVTLSEVRPGSATRRYTDFLLATAWSQGPEVTAVAMSPCMRLYAFLGQSLAASGIPEHPYSDWIRTYSSEAFEPLAQQLEAFVDLHSPDTPIVRDTYRYAMRCERDFFTAAFER
ncbi:MAG: TenA family protein [Leptolyngbyaceae cyanobacterium T60_A2020_046]|nr:TenA family protein [Leptolyngbyaceae cyanobacterium T60_A2020_046]